MNLIVLNPSSGDKKSAMAQLKKLQTEKLPRISALFKNKANSWPIVETDSLGTWKKNLRGLLNEKPIDTVFAIGGDGTLTEVVSCLVEYPKIALFPIPAGRGNDFVRAFWKKPFEEIKHWKKKKVDLASCSDRVFLNMASLGYGGHVVERMHAAKTVWSNWSSVYQIEGAVAFLTTSETRCLIDVNDEVIFDGVMFGSFVGNGRFNAGGIAWLNQACLDDGLLNTIIFPKPSLREMVRSISAMKKNMLPIFEHKTCVGSKMGFKFLNPVPLELDGEYIGTATKYSFKCLPNALTVWGGE